MRPHQGKVVARMYVALAMFHMHLHVAVLCCAVLPILEGFHIRGGCAGVFSTQQQLAHAHPCTALHLQCSLRMCELCTAAVQPCMTWPALPWFPVQDDCASALHRDCHATCTIWWLSIKEVLSPVSPVGVWYVSIVPGCQELPLMLYYRYRPGSTRCWRCVARGWPCCRHVVPQDIY